MMELKIDAEIDNLERVQEYVNQALERAGFGLKQIMQISLAVEEIFCNIANYAYKPDKGEARICCEVKKDNPDRMVIEFIDEGTPYNPLDREDPDIKLSLEERQVGGLGIFLTKKLMDSMEYRHEGTKNILIVTKIKEDEA